MGLNLSFLNPEQEPKSVSYHAKCFITKFFRVMVLETGLAITDKNIQ